MFMGIDGDFMWFQGVVENRKDPDKLGRVQVRIHGIHDEEKILDESKGRGLPTKDLPWAYPMVPITSSSMDGIGQTPLGLVEGSWVFGFARDGRLFNDLVIIGTTGGIPSEKPFTGNKKPIDDQEIGFQDPREDSDISDSPRKYNKINLRDVGYEAQNIPQGRYPQEQFLEEPSINRLARGEKLDDTLLEEKKTGQLRFSPTGTFADDDKRMRQIGIPTTFGVWNENESFYDAKYPYNHVYESESGHVMEFDDTPDNERIHLWHRYGNYMEWGATGDVQNKIIGDNFTVVMKDNKLYVDGDCDITTKGMCNVLAMTGGMNITSLLAPINVIASTAVNITAPTINLNGLVLANSRPVLTA